MKNEVNKIGLIIADENEIHQMNEFKFIKTFHGNFNVDLYEFKNIFIYVIHSKIGLVNAANATQYLIDNFDIKQIWNYGAVGSTTNEIKLYQVVIPKRFYYYDVITPWYKRGQIPGEDEYYLNSLETKEEINIGSGNSFINDINYINDLKKEIDIHLIDMESCAIAQTCKNNSIKFFCIKSVSDIIGFNLIEKNQINDSIKKASKCAFDEMIKWLIKFN